MNNPTGTVTERVAAGAEWLDTIRPGWDREINLKTLEFPSTARCVLGQLYGSLGEGLMATRSRRYTGMSWSEAHGFYARWVVKKTSDAEYRDLTAEWKRLIGARRDGGAS